MKIVVQKESGNTLVVVMILTGILMGAMGTYLMLASQENKTLMRSLYWNEALPLAEAGIEEAMTHLGRNTNGWAVDGWTSPDGTNYVKQRWLSNDFYGVGFSGDLNALVTINSTGSVQWAEGGYVSRAVYVTARARFFPKPMGLVAKTITFQGTVVVDSYDTTTNTGCNPLMYAWYDPLLRSAGAFIGNPLTTFSLGGNVDVRGFVAPGRGFSPPSVAGS